MTIEIHKPELEALIMERIRSGMFQDIEDMLLHALTSSPVSVKDNAATGADLIAAMQDSPYKEIILQPSSVRLPVRDATF
jgi:hypothetical protein